ncbi:MAG: hypothetical protein CL466_08925 [Acidimicrobiaceae bacterium]|nr:hypothetical protein [Acidimicrobiaceae bacterium]
MATNSGPADEVVTLRLPAKFPVGDLPRVALAALLRLHRIDPADVGDLAASVQDMTNEMNASGSDVVIDYRIDESEVAVELSGDGRSLRVTAPRS